MEHHFVTSTGTEIGKTLASVLLIRSLADDHETVGYWKPVASGCDESR
jgi:dethiobiotin synthetase